MSTYVLVDTANTFFRARHVVRGDIDTKVGMALHITLNSVKKAWSDFKADHVVFLFRRTQLAQGLLRALQA
jgi:hypothetical protein